MKLQTKFKETEMGMMPEDWEVEPLGALLELLKDGSHNPPKRHSSGIRFIAGASDLTYRNIDFSNCTYITEEDYQKMHKYYQIKANDILLTIVGTVGNVAIVKEEDLPFSMQRSVAIMRCKQEVFYEFLFYWLTSPKFKLLISSRINTTAQPGIYLGEIAKLLTPVPSLKEQRSIAKILSDLDSKIELNQQMNKTLEAIGQAIFKHWFIDLEEIPEGWETKPLDKIAGFLNGVALQKYAAEKGEAYLPAIKIRELRSGITEQTDKVSLNLPKEYIVEDGDILFSWSGSLEVVIWTNGKGALNQHLFKVASKEYPKWFYYYWTKHHLPNFRRIAEGKATTMGHIQKHNLSEAEVLVPDKKALDEMNKIMSPLLNKMVALRLEANNLSKIRDSLLPKLMSGEIRVK